MLGYPEAAIADTNQALTDAREIGQAATLMYALLHGSMTHIHCANYAEANAEANEVVALADEKGAFFWKALGMSVQGWLLALSLSGEASDAIHMITSAIAALRSTGTTFWMPLHISYLGRMYAEHGRFDDAWRCMREAMAAIDATQERWCEADIHRMAGELALLSPERDTGKAEVYFERALEIGRSQKARSWELRASTGLARLWRDQGKRQQARELLAPVYDWFTEGFDTLDLMQAKALLDELAS